MLFYWDIKNAFNAANHRVIFIVLESKGSPAADIDLIRQLYYGSFLSIGNIFGEKAACFLALGYAQGAPPPSSFLSEITYDPFPTLIRALERGCTVEALKNPSGSSPFADDIVLHSDGPDAISAMRVMVNAGGAYLQWLGLFVKMQKSYLCAVNLADGRPVATDSITLHGSPFRVLLPDEPHTALA